jgi:hypothetical protein
MSDITRLSMKVLPENILRCMSAKDRRSIGQQSAAEAQASADIKSERHLQGMIVNLLRLHGIEVLWHRTDKRSAATVGWPDLTFAAFVDAQCRNRNSDAFWPQTIPCCWEVKLPGGKLSPEQVTMRDKLAANGWRWRCICSVDQARLELKNMGVE